MNGPLPEEQAHALAMTIGSESLWRAVTQLQLGHPHRTPSALKWNLRTANNQWGSEAPPTDYAIKRREVNARLFAAQVERERFAETLRVSRDPCPKCAVRADVGCKHQRTAA